MNKRNVIIIVVIVLVLAVIGGYFLLNGGSAEPTKQSSIILSKSAYIKVPDDVNASHHVDKKGVVYYDAKDVNVTVCSNLSKSSGVSKLIKIKNSIETGSKKLKLNDAAVYLKDGIYSAFIKNSEYNDAILIQSPSKNILLQCLESVSFHDPSVKVDINDTNNSSNSDSGNVIDVIEETETAVGTSHSSSSSSSSQSTSHEDSYTDYYYGSSSSSSRSSGSSSGGSSSGGGKSSLTDYYSQ